MDTHIFKVYKEIAYVSYQFILHYINICKFADMYSVRFKIKTFTAGHYDRIELQIPLKGEFEDNVHQTFFAFFDKYYELTQKHKLFIPPH